MNSVLGSNPSASKVSRSINFNKLIQVQAGSSTLRSEMHKLINSVWNKEKLPQQWKGSIIVPLLSSAYNILSNTSQSALIPYVGENTGDHQSRIRRNR
jgi:hypothetical protein